MAEIRFQRATFSPAEAEALTGVDVVQQRNLRRHGYLPETPSGTWTRFDIATVATLAIVGQCSALGVPPKTAEEISRRAKNAAVLIVAFAQECAGAIDDSAKLANEKPVKLGPIKLRRFLIFCASKVALEDDIAEFYANKSTDTSATIVLDLKRIAERICERAGRPLWIVEEVRS